MSPGFLSVSRKELRPCDFFLFRFLYSAMVYALGLKALSASGSLPSEIQTDETDALEPGDTEEISREPS